MNFETIIFQKVGAIAKIKLNRPKEFNSINFKMISEMVRVLEHCSGDEEIKTVILTGEGKAFCSGGDIRLFTEYFESDPSEPFRQIIKQVNVAIILLRRMPKPVIASINGATGGGGIGLAAACDLRICASSAKFKTGYRTIGLVGDAGYTLMIPLLVGFGRATELLLLDTLIDAKQALDWGLVNHVVEDTELEQFTNNTALRLAEGPTRAFAIAKDNLNHAMIGLLERQLELERVGMTNAAKTSDYIEGVKAFLEKRKPTFTGH
ncbi:MAG: enoyl-CoA hydratase-related protein [Syntrophales bacterium]|jgi:2-(1,2-epoxy-1,2-dihydrophenyl)acetyl-CoA isomerase